MHRRSNAAPKRESNRKKPSSKQRGDALPPEQEHRSYTVERSSEPLVGKTQAQRDYLRSIATNRITFGTGPAGTGKTFVCTAYAADLLADRRIDKLIVTRPMQAAEEEIGFLPGDLQQKFDPYLIPVIETLEERLGKSYVENLLKLGRIEAAPLGFMRGRTFKRAFVILDEAQNTTPKQMMLFLTRIGYGSTMVVNGDPTQMDIQGPCGLVDGMERAVGLPGVGLVHFERKDVVRDDIVQALLERYAH